jgi:DNA-binding GntR family transcriptional regulator
MDALSKKVKSVIEKQRDACQAWSDQDSEVVHSKIRQHFDKARDEVLRLIKKADLDLD